MTCGSKIFIKFIKHFPFVLLINILVFSIEMLFFRTDYIDNISCYFLGYSYFTLIPFLVLSYRLQFCYYHKAPIISLYLLLFLQQIFEYIEVTEKFVYYTYNISILTLVIFVFALSIYLYKHKKTNKR